MKAKRTFFNSRKDRLYDNYVDTNNYLFIILFDTGATMSFILRDLKKNESLLNYIYNKLHNRFSNVAEIATDRISSTEYNLLKQLKVPSIYKIC
tara:strand:+ start:1927 stop:2208 length:282 start_codon:yes stop_codon:yes gene_type:complete